MPEKKRTHEKCSKYVRVPLNTNQSMVRGGLEHGLPCILILVNIIYFLALSDFQRIPHTMRACSKTAFVTELSDVHD